MGCKPRSKVNAPCLLARTSPSAWHNHTSTSTGLRRKVIKAEAREVHVHRDAEGHTQPSGCAGALQGGEGLTLKAALDRGAPICFFFFSPLGGERVCQAQDSAKALGAAGRATGSMPRPWKVAIPELSDSPATRATSGREQGTPQSAGVTRGNKLLPAASSSLHICTLPKGARSHTHSPQRGKGPISGWLSLQHPVQACSLHQVLQRAGELG